jgi:hypothetical protein
MAVGRRWWRWMCGYFVFVLLIEITRAFMLRAGSARPIKAASSNFRPHHLLSSQTSCPFIKNTFSWNIARASSFDGGVSEMVRKV